MNTVLTDREEFFIDFFGLDSADINHIEFNDINGDAFIDILLVPKYEHCPQCGYNYPKIKNYVLKSINHSVFNDRKCIIKYKARRYVCPICNRTYYEHNPFVFKNMKISAKTVINVLNDLKQFNATFSSVAKAHNISSTSVASIFDQHVRVSRKTLPEFINFDEVYAFKYYDEKRHTLNKYCCLLLDFDSQNPIDILPSRTYEYLLSYFLAIPLEERLKVKACCFDMYKTYRSIMKACFP